MTRALTAQNNAEDIGEETPTKPQEPTYVKATEPVIKEPAQTPKSRLAATIEKARRDKEAREQRLAQERQQRDEALAAAEPSRDEIADQAEAITNAALKSPEARAVAITMRDLLAEKQEMIRNVQQTLGVSTANMRELGDDVIEQLAKLVGTNGLLLELIREICAAAGGVRADKVIIKHEGGKMKIIRRFVDVGDEEPDQDPIVDLEWIVPAAIRVKARYTSLLSQHENATKRAIEAELRASELTSKLADSEKERRELKGQVAQLETMVKTQKPNAAGTPDGFFLRTEDGYWVARYDGKHAFFTNRWYLTASQQAAHEFEFKQDADELLQRLHMARMHRIGKQRRETLRVVKVRYEDYT
jgi:hypothetical protein